MSSKTKTPKHHPGLVTVVCDDGVYRAVEIPLTSIDRWMQHIADRCGDLTADERELCDRRAAGGWPAQSVAQEIHDRRSLSVVDVGDGSFAGLTGAERRVQWQAAGGVSCVAERGDDSMWRLVEGPATLVGRSWRHLRDLRQAANAAHLGEGATR